MSPDSRPRWFLVVLRGGGGGLRSCFAGTGGARRKVSSPPVAKPSAPLRWGTTAEGERVWRVKGREGGEGVEGEGQRGWRGCGG